MDESTSFSLISWCVSAGGCGVGKSWHKHKCMCVCVSARARSCMQVHEIMGGGDELMGKEVIVKGWCRTVRDQKAFSFIELNDGSLPKGIQIVAESSIASYSEVQKLTTGAAFAVKGTLVESPAKGQKYEIKASEVTQAPTLAATPARSRNPLKLGGVGANETLTCKPDTGAAGGRLQWEGLPAAEEEALA